MPSLIAIFTSTIRLDVRAIVLRAIAARNVDDLAAKEWVSTDEHGCPFCVACAAVLNITPREFAALSASKYHYVGELLGMSAQEVENAVLSWDRMEETERKEFHRQVIAIVGDMDHQDNELLPESRPPYMDGMDSPVGVPIQTLSHRTFR